MFANVSTSVVLDEDVVTFDKLLTASAMYVYLLNKLEVSSLLYSFAKSFASAHAFNCAKISEEEPLTSFKSDILKPKVFVSQYFGF